MWARISAAYLYPIKACAPLPVPSLAFAPEGHLLGDRAWVVVDPDNRITWQGAIPRLSQIVPSGTPGRLAISSAAGESVALPPPGEGARRLVQGWNGARQAFDEFAGQDAGDAVADLASTIAGQRVRLVHLATAGHLPNPVHLISDASLRAMTSELDPNADLRRFRPNIVLTGDGHDLPPFIEEQASSLLCPTPQGPLALAITGPCERCVVINVSPAAGTLDDRYLKTVAARSRERRAAAPAVFGVYARAKTAGTLATGARVELVSASA